MIAEHTLTPRQYLQARHKALRAGTPHAELAAINECLHEPSLIDDWFKLVFAAAKRGETLRPVVIDRVFELREQSFWLLLKWYGETALPAGYLNPLARAMNKAVHQHKRFRQRAGVVDRGD